MVLASPASSAATVPFLGLATSSPSQDDSMTTATTTAASSPLRHRSQGLGSGASGHHNNNADRGLNSVDSSSLLPQSKSSSTSSSSPPPQKSFFASDQRKAIHANARKNHHQAVHGGKESKSALSFMYRHQIDIPLAIISTVLMGHYIFRIPFFAPFLFLQNQDVSNGLYSKSATDIYFIFHWIVIFTLLRASVMQYILAPFAAKCKLGTHKSTRFQEEGWVCAYYTLSWTLGMYVLRTSPAWNSWTFWFNTSQFFIGYPHYQLPHVMIWYYYVQFAFWLQQIFVLHVEAPRKDFWAMISHHTVTLLLIGGSALSNFWRAGNAVFVVMDLADIILAFSKSLKYLGVRGWICDSFFSLFMISWAWTRHYLYGHIMYAFMFEIYEILPFELDISQGKWFCRELGWLPAFGLILLEILMVYWFGLILRVVAKILSGQSAEDDRSDVEEEIEESVAATVGTNKSSVQPSLVGNDNKSIKNNSNKKR